MKSIDIAIDYIIDKIINPRMERKDDSICVYFAKVNRERITKEQLGYFREVLQVGMMDEIEKYGSSELRTEYMPVGLLYDALLVTDMPLDACPLHLTIKVNSYKVDVSIGKNMPVKTIYKEQERVKKKKLVIY